LFSTLTLKLRVEFAKAGACCFQQLVAYITSYDLLLHGMNDNPKTNL